MAADASSPYICDRWRVRHDTCIEIWQRWRGAFDQNWGVLLGGVSLSDMPSVRCEVEAPYCQKVREMMQNVGGAKIPTEVGLAL